MYRVGIYDDSEGWHQVSMGQIRSVTDDEMRAPILWCKLHTSDGKWDCGIKWSQAVFRFEQLEDALMFRMTWCK